MNEHKVSREPIDDLEFHVSGFAAKVQGAWTDKALEQFQHFLKLRDLCPAKDELLSLLEEAKANYFDGECRLYLCGAAPCRAKIRFEASDSALEAVSCEAGIPVSVTGCQGPCKQAPVLSFRVQGRSDFFAQVVSPADWHTVIEFAKNASAAGTLLIDPGEAEAFRFDPVHDHPKANVHLKPLRFLLGHFRGEGKYVTTPYTFHKELIGTPEAGGRFIALRMDVSYPLFDGTKDVHKALVIVGAEPSTGYFSAQAYTDGGLVREYTVEPGDGFLEFTDVPPGHGNRWKRARKTLTPTAVGFEERLDVDAGGGFTPYYVISMRKLARSSQA
jgi:hypothetical protein